MTNVNQAPLPRLSKAPLVRASLVKRRYIKYLAFFPSWQEEFKERYLLSLEWKRVGVMDNDSGDDKRENNSIC